MATDTVHGVNRLADETSPYLRQHRDNPVDWYPWGPEAFTAARERNVAILLSVGYSACHWCHVMAHECFEDADVAAKMNELFVNVKVDREERPDVDAVYMDAVQAMTGRGGWPMTVFMTPDGEPFYGGTYFPKDAFVQLMDAIDDVYRNKPADVRQNVEALVKAIDTTANLRPATAAPGIEQLNQALQTLAASFDQEWGGFGKAPKFPSTFHLELMLRAYMTNAGDGPKNIVATTLDAMCSGGMYDHIGGGFARYSTDREWLVPHFEKMLYDQALLLGTYLRAMIVIGRPQYRLVVEETIDYVLTTLRHPDGGFYSAEDADSLDPDGQQRRGLVLHLDTRRGTRRARRSRRGDRRDAHRLVRDHRRGKLRGPIPPQPPVGTRPTDANARTRRCAPPAPRRSFTASPARSRRQGPDRMECVVPLVARSGCRSVRTPRLARRCNRQRRVPAARTSRRQRPLVSQLAG